MSSYCDSNSEPCINRSFYKKNRSLPRTRAMYLVIDHSWHNCRRISHFSLFVTLLYLCDIVQFPHLSLEVTLTTGFLFVWFPLTGSLTNIAVFSLDQMRATTRPYTVLRHRLCSLKVSLRDNNCCSCLGFTCMFIILIPKNRMFNQSPIFSTTSAPNQSFHVVARGTQRLVSVK